MTAERQWDDRFMRELLAQFEMRRARPGVTLYELVHWLGVPVGRVYPAVRHLERQGRIVRCSPDPPGASSLVPQHLPRQLRRAWRLAEP